MPPAVGIPYPDTFPTVEDTIVPNDNDNDEQYPK
jgi:hypothetical protein